MIRGLPLDDIFTGGQFRTDGGNYRGNRASLVFPKSPHPNTISLRLGKCYLANSF